MDFASRITRRPRPFNLERGAEARAMFEGLDAGVLEVIEGACGSSPYLNQLAHQEHTWLRAAVDKPEKALADLLAALAHDQDVDPGPKLRQAKARVALLTALADLGGVWSLTKVTKALTDFADVAVGAALRYAVGREIQRGKLPGQTEDDIADCGGIAVLAMGKMGAFELNYSSDIDLICLFDETRYKPDDYHDARASLIRATRSMAAILNDKTADGYVFRVDLRLRPDPSVTPVCMAMTAAETYYESLGRTWERAAYIKARTCAGDIGAGNRFLETLRPFVWRRHLDFAAIEDAHNMRLRIREHKGTGGPISLAKHHMKLGQGGIREIEFFTQTRQIIAGGRDNDLQVRGTVEGLQKLAAKDWIPQATADQLQDHYVFHRTVEHRLQMVHDAQTHVLPSTKEEFDRLAAMMGCDTADLEAELLDRLNVVHDTIEGFFTPDDAGQVQEHKIDLDEAIIERWHSYPALRSNRAVEIFKRLRPDLLARLAATSHPHEALLAFDRFLSGLPAGVQVFSMFDANPHLLDLLIDIVGTSSVLSAHLSQNAGVFDAVIAGDFFADWPGLSALALNLSDRLAAEDDYESRLDTARRWRKEWHFRVGVHHLRGLINAAEAGAQYSDIAEAIICALWPVVCAHFSEKHGIAPGRGAVVVGMGSLGAGRLTAVSDLDLIVIYDAPGNDMSDGRRPLMARQYYARLTQALITALTAPTAEGRLYEVDMRLRPSGNQGPVATGWGAFQDYQNNDAWVWEHLAMTRARALTGQGELMADFETFRAALLPENGNVERVLPQVADMRVRLAKAKSPDGPWDVKRGPGRLQDIELIAQAGLLASGQAARDVDAGLDACAAIGWIDDAGRQDLGRAFGLCSLLKQATRLLSDGPLDVAKLRSRGAEFILHGTGFETMDELQTALATHAAAAAAQIDLVLGVVAEPEEKR